MAPREALPMSDSVKKSDPFFGLVSKPASPNPGRTIAYLPESGQVIRALPTWQVPKEVVPEGRCQGMVSYLSWQMLKEVVLEGRCQGMVIHLSWQVSREVFQEGGC